MNKKIMALAVAGAFVAPAAAFAQASNVQVFGTMYMEYTPIGNQGQKAPAAAGGVNSGDFTRIDVLQSPGSEVGIKGEEALGGGTTAWFQCVSTADIRGAGTGGGIQGFCGRNSAIGLKGSFGNAYVGNWDMPMKKTAGAARIVSDTGIWGAGPMLFSNSSSFNDGASPTVWSRRQNNSIHYDSPVFSGFQAFASISTPSSAVGATSNVSGTKPRTWGLAVNYTNGPLLVTAGFEQHQNFNPAAGAVYYNAVGTVNGTTLAAVGGAAPNAAVGSTDTGWQIGAAYQFGPVKLGALYTKQKYDFGVQNGVGADGSVSAWNVAGQWAIVGPHSLRGGYTKANSTSGSYNGGFGAAPAITPGALIGNRVFNGGIGATGGNIWQIQYVYNASKRTEMTAGYVRLQNDANARYSLGGLSTPNAGANQDAIAVSIKNTF